MTIENFENEREHTAPSQRAENNVLNEIKSCRQSYVEEQNRAARNNSDSMSQFGTPEFFDSSANQSPINQGDGQGTGYGQHVGEQPQMTPIGGPEFPVYQQLRTVPKERDEEAIYEDCMKYLYLQDNTIFGTDYNPLHQRVRRSSRH